MKGTYNAKFNNILKKMNLENKYLGREGCIRGGRDAAANMPQDCRTETTPSGYTQ